MKSGIRKNPCLIPTDTLKRRVSCLALGMALAMLNTPAWADDEEHQAIGRFDISRFDVQGNTLLPAATIEHTLQPFTGSQRNFGHVQQALEALEAEYHRLGFNVVQVALPEQELNQGVVRFQVIETRIGKVRVEGNRVFNEANIRRSLPELREGQTPNLGKVSSSLKLANENSAKKTSLHLQSGDQDDEIHALLKVEDDKAWKIASSVDNTGNDSTGRSHLTVQFQHANIADQDHVLSAQYSTTLEKPSQVSVYGAGYRIPLYAQGDSIDLFASYSDVDSGSVSAGIFDLQVSGKGTVVGARYNQHLRRVSNYESRLIYGLDYKAYRNNVALQGVQLGNDVTVHPLSVAYAGAWTLANGEASFSVTAIQNLPGGSRGGDADFNRARAGAAAGYRMLRYSAGYSHAWQNDWQMRVNLSGQYTRHALIPGEQFGAGGASSVRGFRERDVSNDVGQLLNAEVYTPNVCAATESVALQCRMVVFYDMARATRNRALPGEVTQASIASAGIGARITVGPHFTLQMDYGQVVDAGISQNEGDHRLHFRLGLTY